MFPKIWEFQKYIIVPTEINIFGVIAQNDDLGGLKIKTRSSKL